MKMHNPPHPGSLIRRTYIEPYEHISERSIAKALGVSPSTFGRMLNGGSISPDMAIRLSKAIGRSAESWLALQAQYDLSVAENEGRAKFKGIQKLQIGPSGL